MRKFVYGTGASFFAWLEDAAHAVFLWCTEKLEKVTLTHPDCKTCGDLGWNYYNDLAMPCHTCFPSEHARLRGNVSTS